MLNNETRRELLNRAKAVQFPGSIMEVYRASEQGIDLLADHEAQMQQEMQVAQTQQQQETGLREEHARGNTQASMAFPNVQPNQSFNTEGMAAPINVDKYNNQGHLVESYKNVPPGIKDLPTGPYEGTVIETPAEYQKGGFENQFNTNYQESQNYQRIKNSRKGTRKNSEGSESTHLMADNNKDEAWPTLFQDKDGNWFEGGYEEAKRRGEIYKFDSKKELIDFARKGNWKNAYQKGGVKEDIGIHGNNLGLTDRGKLHDWYINNMDKPNFGYDNYEDFKADWPTAELDGGVAITGEGGPEYFMDQERKPEKLIKLPPRSIEQISTSEVEGPKKLPPFELMKNNSSHFTVSYGGAQGTWEKEDGLPIIQLKDKSGGVVWKGSQTEYEEKYGDWLERGDTEYGERKKHRLYLKNKMKKGGLRKRKYIKKYQNGGFEQQYKKGGSWTNWVNPLYLAERVKNQIPLNVRQLTADLVGSEDSINLNDLNYREKAALEEARKNAEKRGSSVIEYQDYGTHLDDEGNAYQDPYADVGGGAGYQMVTKSLNPSYSLKTTFGQMGFKKNKDGTYTYTDQYNFNNATGGGVKGWWEGAKNKGLDLYGQVRNVATNFGSENKKGAEVKINMRKGGYRAKYPKGGLKLNSPLLKRNDFSLAKRNLEHNAFIPGDGSTGHSLVNRLEGMGDDLSKNFNLATNPTFLNTKKLNLKGSFNADPGVGWDGSNKGFSSFGSPTLNPTGAASFDLAYRPTKKTTLNAGVDYKTGSSPYYRAGLNIKLKRGGYRKKYL